jgi:hypothetical protein
MKVSIDGKITKEFWILLATALLVLVGASHETIIEVIL